MKKYRTTQILTLILIVLTIIATACTPARSVPPTQQKFDSTVFTLYPGAWKSIDAAQGKTITKEDIKNVVTQACSAALKTVFSGTQGDVKNVAAECVFGAVVKVGMNNGTNSCVAYSVVNDAVVGLDKLDIASVYSYAIAVFPIPEDAETIAKTACK